MAYQILLSDGTHNHVCLRGISTSNSIKIHTVNESLYIRENGTDNIMSI